MSFYVYAQYHAGRSRKGPWNSHEQAEYHAMSLVLARSEWGEDWHKESADLWVCDDMSIEIVEKK